MSQLTPSSPAQSQDPGIALSVVIPTHNRRARLAETLEALARQSLSGQEILEDPQQDRLEVVVVDDGSSDDTLSYLDSLVSYPHRLRIVRQEPSSGPAVARNRGVRECLGERVLFLGDDTRPAPGCLAGHLEMATRHGGAVAIQGHIDWDPEREITPLMAFLAPDGPQFYFRGLEQGRPIPFTAVLGSNLSAPRHWLEEEPFDESFPHAAVEDTEMAWRWQRRGWFGLYHRDARCWHHHRYDELEPFLERQRRAGASARRAARLHPSLLWPLILQPTLFGFVVRARKLVGRGRPTDAWDLACRRAFLEGALGRQAKG